MRAVKLCTNKILQFLTVGVADCPYTLLLHYTRLTALFPGLRRSAGTNSVKALKAKNSNTEHAKIHSEHSWPGKTLWQLSETIQWVKIWRFAISCQWLTVQLTAHYCLLCRLPEVTINTYINNTHTHTRFTALCLRLPRWASSRKVKPIWILLKQETVSGSGISWAVCRSASHSRQITTPATHHSVFLQAGCPSCHPTNSVKAHINNTS